MTFFHGHESESEQVLSGEDVDAGVVVDFLMKVHAIEGLWLNLVIGPPEVPISSPFLPLDDPAEFFCDFFDDGVLSVGYVDDYLLRF